MKTRKLQLLLVVLISALIGYYVGVSKISLDWKNYHPSVAILSKEPPPAVSNVDFSMFWNVLDKIETSYYDKKAIDPQKLVNGAISGMVQSLGDPYTLYFPPLPKYQF